jgi:hypothetical protein
MPIPGVTGSSDNRQPGTPTIGAATAGNASVSVAFTAPANTGKPNTSLLYTATTTPNSIIGTSSTSPITISGLANGTSYTAVVKLNNTVQDSLNSAASNSFTPIAPPFFPSFAAPPYFPSFAAPPYFPYFAPTPVIPSFTSNPTVTNIDTNGGTLSWASVNQASYVISAAGTALNGSSGFTATSRLFTGLSAGTTYSYQVTITSSTGHTATAPIPAGSFTTTGAPPYFPTFTAPPYFPTFTAPPSFPFFPPYFPPPDKSCTNDDVLNNYANCFYFGECLPFAAGAPC